MVAQQPRQNRLKLWTKRPLVYALALAALFALYFGGRSLIINFHRESLLETRVSDKSPRIPYWIELLASCSGYPDLEKCRIAAAARPYHQQRLEAFGVLRTSVYRIAPPDGIKNEEGRMIVLRAVEFAEDSGFVLANISFPWSGNTWDSHPEINFEVVDELGHEAAWEKYFARYSATRIDSAPNR